MEPITNYITCSVEISYLLGSVSIHICQACSANAIRASLDGHDCSSNAAYWGWNCNQRSWYGKSYYNIV